MMTEDEAKTKWCPMFRHEIYPMDDRPSGGNSMQIGSTVPACIGSECMMWRGRETIGFATKAESEFRRTGIRLKPTGTDMEGYCGLAGRPE